MYRCAVWIPLYKNNIGGERVYCAITKGFGWRKTSIADPASSPPPPPARCHSCFCLYTTVSVLYRAADAAPAAPLLLLPLLLGLLPRPLPMRQAIEVQNYYADLYSNSAIIDGCSLGLQLYKCVDQDQHNLHTSVADLRGGGDRGDRPP